MPTILEQNRHFATMKRNFCDRIGKTELERKNAACAAKGGQMENVRRIYVEKKTGFAVQAKDLKDELRKYLGVSDCQLFVMMWKIYRMMFFEKACKTVFAEPPVDTFTKKVSRWQRMHAYFL